jgi:DNA-binding NarL/FixJ family response regulator
MLGVSARRSHVEPGDACSSKITVFLVDDHEVVRQGLRHLLEAEDDIDVIGEAATAGEAVDAILDLAPRVAVLDVRLPDGSGVEVCREVRSKNPDILALMLTSYSEDEALFDAVLAGASGYVLKEVRGLDLVGQIRKVAGGGSLISADVARRAMERMRRREADDPAKLLTHQEQRILELVAVGMTNRQIAAEMYLSEKTVKNYVSNMLSKLGMSRRTEAAVYAVRHGATGRTGPDRKPLS